MSYKNKRQPKTEGLEWLFYSMSAFNGSGYANKDTAQDYYESYKMYKRWRKKLDAVRLAEVYEVEALTFSEKMLESVDVAPPSDKNLAKYRLFIDSF